MANLNPPFLNEPPDKTRPDVKPLGYLIDREKPIKRRLIFGHQHSFWSEFPMVSRETT
jgi:hypothetical protein